MREIKLNPIEDVLKLIEKYTIQTESQWIDINDSIGRILVDDLIADQMLPPYRKSTVDGYALIDDQKKRKYLIGEHEITTLETLGLTDHCLYVPTGGRVPEDASHVVKIEETLREGDYVIFNDFMDNNIIEPGADMVVGKRLKKKNTEITVFDIGVFASLGHQQIKVYKQPVLSIISTGDELIAIEDNYYLGAVRDVNTYTLAASASAMGIQVCNRRIIKDSYDLLKETILKELDHCDFLLVSGGSSMGKKDFTYDVLTEIGQVFSYGMALKPGKPTILSLVNGKAVFGLPGHPVSAVMVFRLLMEKYLCHYHIYKQPPLEYERILNKDIYAAKGRDTYQMVTFDNKKCYPTSGKSGLVTLLSESDGYTIIEKDCHIKKGSKVICYKF